LPLVKHVVYSCTVSAFFDEGLRHLSLVEKRKMAWYDGVMKNISDEQTVFRIEKGYKRSMLYTTVIFLFFSSIGLLVMVINPLKNPGEYIIVILWETICLIFIIYSSSGGPLFCKKAGQKTFHTWSACITRLQTSYPLKLHLEIS
jgi:hypothetical protein